MNNFDYLLISHDNAEERRRPLLAKFEILAEIQGFDRIEPRPFSFPPLAVKLKPAILVLKRRQP